MPVIKSAKKKLRQDKKREKANLALKNRLKGALKQAQKTKTADKVLKAVKLVDKAAQKRIIHKNKAARIKSSLSKLVKRTKTKVKSPTKSKAQKNKK